MLKRDRYKNQRATNRRVRVIPKIRKSDKTAPARATKCKKRSLTFNQAMVGNNQKALGPRLSINTSKKLLAGKIPLLPMRPDNWKKSEINAIR